MTIDDADLPELCLALVGCNRGGERIVAIRRGRGGYYRTDYDSPNATLAQARALVDELNASLGVSEDQKGLMILRSMGKWPQAATAETTVH
jgi:hypothetical protein